MPSYASGEASGVKYFTMKKRKYTRELLEEAVTKARSLTEVLRNLGFESYSGASSNLIRSRLLEFGIDTSHFVGLRTQLGKPSTGRKSATSVLVSGYTKRAKHAQLKRAMLETGIAHECAVCKTGPCWNNRPLVLHIDHLDGDWRDCRLHNVRFLCPNCHSQTASWGRKTRNLV